MLRRICGALWKIVAPLNRQPKSQQQAASNGCWKNYYHSPLVSLAGKAFWLRLQLPAPALCQHKMLVEVLESSRFCQQLLLLTWPSTSILSRKMKLSPGRQTKGALALYEKLIHDFGEAISAALFDFLGLFFSVTSVIFLIVQPRHGIVVVNLLRLLLL